MQKEEELLKKRLGELAGRAYSRGSWAFSNFLSLAEQEVLATLHLDAPYTLWGGYEAAERRMACFGSEDLCGYVAEPPVACLKIEPVNAKFADALTHRDFLGSLMALGMERSVLGDIVVKEGCGWLFCQPSFLSYLTEELHQVKHTTVRCAPVEPPDFVRELPPETEVVAASERVDALIAGVYHLSRAEGKTLVEDGLVYLSGRLARSPGTEVEPGTIVSVRGKGRFRYEGIQNETRRGRMRARVRIY